MSRKKIHRRSSSKTPPRHNDTRTDLSSEDLKMIEYHLHKAKEYNHSDQKMSGTEYCEYLRSNVSRKQIQKIFKILNLKYKENTPVHVLCKIIKKKGTIHNVSTID